MLTRRAKGTAGCYWRAAKAFEEWRAENSRTYDDPYLIRAFADSLAKAKYEIPTVALYRAGAVQWLEFLREQGNTVADQRKAIIQRRPFRIKPQLDAAGISTYVAAVDKLAEPWRTALL